MTPSQSNTVQLQGPLLLQHFLFLHVAQKQEHPPNETVLLFPLKKVCSLPERIIRQCSKDGDEF